MYTEGVAGALGRLNPLLDWNNPADRDADRLIFSGLVKFDSHGLPQADLAESWGTSADGTIYNFTIRPNAEWQDGTPVTSDDVIFTIDLIKSSSLFPQDIKDLWGQIDVKRLNDKNLEVHVARTVCAVPGLRHIRHSAEAPARIHTAGSIGNVPSISTRSAPARTSSIICSSTRDASRAWC